MIKNLRGFFLAFLAWSGTMAAFGQTPVPMKDQTNLTYTEGFANISTWTNNFASGTGANRFKSVATNSTGTVPDGVKITTSSATFTTGTSGGVQKGTNAIVLLATSTPDNSTAVAFDLLVDFSSVKAGKLSFDWAEVNNSTGDRKNSLRIYTSPDGTAFTELTGAQVLNYTNNVASNSSITDVQLPSGLDGKSTAVIRFYCYNGTGGTTGSRPKVSIDNIKVTAVDNTPPAFASGYPKTANLTSTSVDVTTNTDEAGTTYYVVLPAASAAPTAAQVKAGQDASGTPVTLSGSFANTANTDATKSITGLTASTAYNIYAVAEDAASTPNLQTAVSALSITTTSAADVTPPVYASGYPKTANLAATSVDLTTNTDEAGTSYYVVLPSASAAPSAAQVKAGQDASGTPVTISGSFANTANTDATKNITGLTASTAYKIYVIAQDAASTPNLQSTVSALTVTTPAAADVTPPVYASGYPKTANLAATSVDVISNMDEAGTTYYEVLPSAATAPTAAQVKAGQDASNTSVTLSGSFANTASTDATKSITGLTASTAYKIYVVSQDAAATPNLQATVSTLSVTTPAPPDVTPPVFASGYPKTANLASNSVDLTTNTDEAGTTYYVLSPAATAAPTVSQIMAGQDGTGSAALKSGNVANTANTDATASITGLTASTDYKIYVVAKDAASTPNVQATASALSITTPAAGPVASTILAWEFNGALGNEVTIASTTTDANLNSSSVTRGTGTSPVGLSPSALGNAYSSTSFTQNGSFADAVTNNKYVQFTVSAKPGNNISLTTLNAAFRRSSTGPNKFQWQYSLDGFNTAGVNIGSEISYALTTTNGDAQTPINLGGIAALQNVPSTTTISFRLYGYGASATGGTFALGRITGNDLSLVGIVGAGSSGPGDTTPPVTAAGYPKTGNITSNSVDLTSNLNEAGTTYYVVLPSAATAPTAAQVKAGQDASNAAAFKSGTVAIIANTDAVKTITALASNTNYNIYTVSDDIAGNLQTAIATLPVTTNSAPPPVSTSIIISQYYEGTSTNKWIELTNLSGSPVNTFTQQLKLALYNISGDAGNISTAGTPSQTVDLNVIIPAYGTVLIGNTGNGTEVPYLTAASAAQTSNTVINFNGNDGVALIDANGNVLDAFGDGINAKDASYVRNLSVTAPSPTFNIAEWEKTDDLTVVQNAIDSDDPNKLGVHLPPNLPACTAPVAQPTALAFTKTTTSITGSFTAATADEYLVVRSLQNTLTANPVNGTAYNAGDALGGGKVIGRIANPTFTDNTVVSGQPYYYFIFSLNNTQCVGGPLYLTANPLTGQQASDPLPVCASPLQQPTSFQVTNYDYNTIQGTFSTVNGVDQYLVVMSTSSTLSAMPQNQHTYAIGDQLGGGLVIKNGAGGTFNRANLAANTTYYFFIFSANTACSGGPLYLVGSPLTGSQKTNVFDPTQLHFYYGNLHSHTSYSDGNKDDHTKTPVDAYAFAKNSKKMDFLGISEHNHTQAGMHLANWQPGIDAARNATTSDFVAMHGMEWGVISGGGHVVVYGIDSLIGWEAGEYQIYVAKSTYVGNAGLFRILNRHGGNTIATLAHPNTTDFNNIAGTAYDVSADSAIVGSAVESGPAFSTNITYSDPASPLSYLSYYNKLLAKGYHIGPTIDHDNHNMTFGRTTRSRLVVLAPTLTENALLDGMKKMRFYASEDSAARVTFTVSNQPIGSVMTAQGAPQITVSTMTTNPVTSIKIWYGVPGSGTTATVLTTGTSGTLSYTDNTLANLGTEYYYVDITESDGTRIITSPVWYKRDDASKTDQHISLAATANATYGDPDIDPAGISDNTAIPVTYTSGNTSIATIVNNKVHPVAAGTVTITANQAADAQHNAAAAQTQIITIAPRTLAVKADTESKTYGDNDPALSYTITSGTLVNGDTFSGSLTRAAGEIAGKYAISQGTLVLNNNYTLTFTGDSLTIGKVALTVKADAKSKNYGDADPLLTYQISSGALKFNDTFSGAITRAAGNNAGIYAITQGTLSANSNYTLSFANSALTIAPKAITITAAAKSKTYGDADPTLTYTPSSTLIGTDSFTGSLTRDAGENTGNYAIKQGSLALSSNYTLNFTGSTLNISQKAITVTADAKSKIFGQADPQLTYKSIPALIGTDSFTGSLTRDAGENAGNYAIKQGSLALSSNYTLSFTGNTLTISPANRILTFNPLPAKTYGDGDFNAGGSVNTNETITYSSSNPAVATITGNTIHITGTGSTVITASVAASANYTTTTTINQTLTVAKADQSITLVSIPVLKKGGTFDLSTIKATSGLPLSFTTADTRIASVQGNNLTGQGIGSTTLTIKQAGNANYNAANPVTIDLRVTADEEIIVHQAVSPNGDGVNDYLYIEGLQQYNFNQVTIVNRSGYKVFEIRNYDNNQNVFNGYSNLNGHRLDQGTYFYVIEYMENGQARRKTGYFVLKY